MLHGMDGDWVGWVDTFESVKTFFNDVGVRFALTFEFDLPARRFFFRVIKPIKDFLTVATLLSLPLDQAK